MCGIFGVITKKESNFSNEFLFKSLKNLGKLSQTRGKDSSGLCVLDSDDNTFYIYKGAITTSELFKNKEVVKLVQNIFLKKNISKIAFGHARLVTNGSQLNPNNNQPIVKDDIIGIHNGIITNVDDLWGLNSDIVRENEIDSEVLFSLIRKELNHDKSIEHSVRDSILKICGTASIALSFKDYNKFILATNNGSLYILHNNDIVYFASEKAMLNSLIKKNNLNIKIGKFNFFQLSANSLFSIDLDTFKLSRLDFSDDKQNKKQTCCAKRKINVKSLSSKDQLSAVIDINSIGIRKESTRERKMLIYPWDKIKKIKRCTKCVLPETFPFIYFDSNGVCNYCKNHKKNVRSNSLDELYKLVGPYRKKRGIPDVLVPFSGGRDSTFSLHIIKKELDLNPITYTYDWGMVTDLARRNIARTCGKLGVENIIVAADVKNKRKNIKLNIKAWLKQPKLGMIPLFMAGDKYFFYYANKVSKENNLDLTIWGSNYLENTDFKTGFCGIKPNFEKERIDSLNFIEKFKLLNFFASSFLTNPSYINSSLINTFGASLSRYAIKRSGYFQLFDYFLWDEKKVNSLITKEYDWELSVDTNNTWRIGDGTAAFYNYIYFLIAGFSEFDTFRSNQVREGLISRNEALNFIEVENFPRYETIKWYLEIIGLNFEDVIMKVNDIKRMY